MQLVSRRQPDIDRAQALVASLAPATQMTYASAWRRFEQWQAQAQPAHEDADCLAGFVEYLVHLGMKHGTVKTFLSAVRSILNGLGRPVAADAPALKVALRASAQRGCGTKQAWPVGWAQSDEAVNKAMAEGTLTGYRDAALIALMSDCLLRAQEALALQWSDIRFGRRTILIRRSKTDREGLGAVVAFGPPVEHVLLKWHDACRYLGPMVFHKVYGNKVGGPLTSTNAVRAILAKRFPGATAHSLRVGSAQSLVEAGASTAQLAQAGRWKNHATANRYAAHGLARHSAAVKLRYGKEDR